MSFRLFMGKCALVAFGLSSLLSSANLLAQDDSAPKYDFFVGYQWLHPGGTFPNPFRVNIPDMAAGVGASLTRNFGPHWGLEGDFGHNWDNYETTAAGGPRLIFRSESAAFFIHGLLSYNRLSVNGLNASNGIGGILGGGMDLKISRLVSWRVFEADYVPAHHSSPSDLTGVRLRTGLVFSLGYPSSNPVAASVAVEPSQVMSGEPLTARAAATNFNPKHPLTYEWSSTCGKITGSGETAKIDSNGVPGGSCTTSVRVVDPRLRKNNEASASTNFTVKEPPKNPPTVSCSAEPGSVQTGGKSTVSCTCSSPDNVPVSMGDFSVSAGTIEGSGNTVTLNTAGASPGVVTVNATCNDQRGLSTPATAQVTVESPPAPSPEAKQLEARLALHSIYFPTAQPTPAKPNGGLVSSQQETLTRLAADFKKYLESRPDAHLILEGHTDPRGSAEYNQSLSERRVNSTRNFLVEQGVPEANIETKAYGQQQQLSAEEVKASVEQDTQLTPGERNRILANMRTIILASNRRVDVRLSTTGQESVRQFPFNAADALTLIGGRERATTERRRKR